MNRDERNPVKACDVCRRKKVKCDGTRPICSNCKNDGAQCSYTHTGKLEANSSAKADATSGKRIDKVEERLDGIESVLRDLRLHLTEKDQRSLGLSNESIPRIDESRSALRPQHERNLALESIPDHDAPLVEPRVHHEVAAEDPAAFGMMAVIEQSQSQLFGDNHPTGHVLDNSGDSIRLSPNLGSTSGRHDALFLPPMDKTLPIIRQYFQNFNSSFPLFLEAPFMRLISQAYSNPYHIQDLELWAALHSMLSIAHILRAVDAVNRGEENKLADTHLQLALSVVTDITINTTSMLGVQALLGMAVILQGSPNPHSASILVAAAIKLIHKLGMHINPGPSEVSTIESEQRRRVFWIAYTFDKDLSLRLGQPPLQKNEDMETDLPCQEPKDGLGTILDASGTSTFNYFRHRCRLAVIQNEIYRRLYSLQAKRQAESERRIALQELNNMLERWQERIPPTFKADALVQSLAGHLLLPLVILHLSYFNSLSMVHQLSIQNPSWMNHVMSSTDPYGCPNSISLEICVSSALSSVRLVNLVPQGEYGFTWLLLHYCVSGIVVLLGTATLKPNDPKAMANVELVRPLVGLLKELAESVGNEDVVRIANWCSDLHDRARGVSGEITA